MKTIFLIVVSLYLQNLLMGQSICNLLHKNNIVDSSNAIIYIKSDIIRFCDSLKKFNKPNSCFCKNVNSRFEYGVYNERNKLGFHESKFLIFDKKKSLIIKFISTMKTDSLENDGLKILDIVCIDSNIVSARFFDSKMSYIGVLNIVSNKIYTKGKSHYFYNTKTKLETDIPFNKFFSLSKETLCNKEKYFLQMLANFIDEYI